MSFAAAVMGMEVIARKRRRWLAFVAPILALLAACRSGCRCSGCEWDPEAYFDAIDMTAHKAHYPAINGPGVGAAAVARIYEVMEHRADQ
jgi:hypothetical protein